MAGKRGIRNVPGMRHRKTGGKKSEGPDGFDRSDPGTLASLVDAWLLGICFWREAPGAAVGPDRRAGKWGLSLPIRACRQPAR